MDVIGLELNLADGSGTARFYKNGVYEGLEFTNLLQHPSFASANVQERGLRICVSLTDVSESVTLIGYQTGHMEVSYTNDVYDRDRFMFNIQHGYAEGKGEHAAVISRMS